MSVVPGEQLEKGQPRSEADAAFLGRFDHWMRFPIVISAILPLVIVPEANDWISIVVGIVTWLVFLVDYIVHARHTIRYRSTRLGLFDLFVVVVTAPWFLIPGAHNGRFIEVIRLARLARIVVASRGSRRLFNRLGRVAVFAVLVVVVGGLVAYHAEHPVNHEFATVGDSIWWAIVTLTTVGYGDIVPVTPTGRWVAVFIMITGVAVLGLLSGSLASFFRPEPAEASSPGPADAGSGSVEDAPAGPAASDGALQALTHEVSALRQQVEALTERLSSPPGLADPAEAPDGGQ